MNVSRRQIARTGRAYLATVLYVWIICRIMVAAVANKAMHIIPNDITTGPATYLAGSVPMPSTKAP